MTFKQLLDSLSFEEIAPFVDKYDEGMNPAARYKQHFDYLRHLTPAEGVTGEVCVSYWKDPDPEEDEAENDGGEGCFRRLSAFPLEGDLWESSLAKTLVIDEEVTESPAEIAACCLWHTSFYGFLPEEQSETFRNFHEGEKKSGYYYTKYRDIIPSRREMQSVPSFHQTIRRRMRLHRKPTKKEAFPWREGDPMRRWRYWKRVKINEEYFKRIEMNAGFIEDVLERGANVSEPPALTEFSKLFRANHVSIHRCDTLSYNAAERMNYLCDLIEKYGMLREEMCLPNSFLCISASPEHPLTDGEAAEIRELVTAGHCGEHRIWAKSDDSCGEDLRVDIAYYE